MLHLLLQGGRFQMWGRSLASTVELASGLSQCRHLVDTCSTRARLRLGRHQPPPDPAWQTTFILEPSSTTPLPYSPPQPLLLPPPAPHPDSRILDLSPITLTPTLTPTPTPNYATPSNTILHLDPYAPGLSPRAITSNRMASSRVGQRCDQR